jgi:hypothetical protein
VFSCVKSESLLAIITFDASVPSILVLTNFTLLPEVVAPILISSKYAFIDTSDNSLVDLIANSTDTERIEIGLSDK